MFKRSGSKTSVASSQHKSTPQIRPTYINASMRGANKASSLTMARNSTLEIPAEHVKILEEITAIGRVPASTTWENVRDEVCAPLIEQLLGIAIACRSDSFLPNGKWIGSGPAPDADGVIKGLGGDCGLLGGADDSDDEGDNARNTDRKTSRAGAAAASQNGVEANQQSVGGGGDGDDGARTPKTAPTTPVADGEGYGGNVSRQGMNGEEGEADGQRGGGPSSDQDSDSDNDTAGRNKARRASVASVSSSNATVTNPPPHDVVPAVLDYSDFEAENDYIMDQWCSLEAPIFTLQRLAEIILQHRRHHCFSAEHPFGAAAIALGGATVDVIGTGGNSKAKHSNATGRQQEEAAAVAEESEGILKSPRSRGVLRGEKLQMAIRRCVLVAALDSM